MLTTDDTIQLLILFPNSDISKQFPTYAHPIAPCNCRSLHPCTGLKCQCPQAISRRVYNYNINLYPQVIYYNDIIPEYIRMYTHTKQIPCCATLISGHSTSIQRYQQTISSCKDIDLYTYMIDAIKSQPESNTLKQSIVNMGATTITLVRHSIEESNLATLFFKI